MQEKKQLIIALKPHLKDILNRNPDILNYIDVLPNGTNIIFRQSRIPETHRQRYVKLYRQATMVNRPKVTNPPIKQGIPLDAVLSYLKPSQRRTYQTTGKKSQQDSLQEIREIDFKNEEMLPWLRSNITKMPNIKIIRFNNYYTEPEILTRFFEIINTGNFQLIEFYFTIRGNYFGNIPNQAELLDFFFKKFCLNLKTLKIFSQNLWNINIPLNELKEITIDFSTHPQSLPNNAPVIRHLPKLTSIIMHSPPTSFIQYFFESCIHQQIEMKEIIINNTVVDSDQQSLQVSFTHYVPFCIRLKRLSLRCNEYEIDCTNYESFTPLLTKNLESLSIDFLTKNQLDYMGNTCSNLQELNLGYILNSKYTDPVDFRNFLETFINKKLTTLSLRLDEKAIKFHYPIHHAFPNLETLSIECERLPENQRDLIWFYQSLFKCNLINLCIDIPYDAWPFALLEFLKNQQRLIKFISKSPIDLRDFVTIINVLIKFTLIKYLSFRVDFLELWMIASYLPLIKDSKSIEINCFKNPPNLEYVVDCMHIFLQIFQSLDVQMPNLETLRLILNFDIDKLTISFIPDFNRVYLPLLKKNCPKLKVLELGGGEIKL